LLVLNPFEGFPLCKIRSTGFLTKASATTGEESALTTWAPAVDIYETPNELVVKADLPDVNEKDIDVRVENNLLTIRGERKFEKSVSEENYLRVERTYGAFSRSFSLPNTVNPETIRRGIQERRADR
jgi:HSP20 family protein